MSNPNEGLTEGSFILTDVPRTSYGEEFKKLSLAGFKGSIFLSANRSVDLFDSGSGESSFIMLCDYSGLYDLEFIKSGLEQAIQHYTEVKEVAAASVEHGLMGVANNG